MTRTEKIERKIQKLEAQLEYYKAELERAKKSDADEEILFSKIPARVRNRFDDIEEFRRFIYGQHDGKVCGCSSYEYERAKTPYERLCSINGVGVGTAKDTLRALRIKSEKICL